MGNEEGQQPYYYAYHAYHANDRQQPGHNSTRGLGLGARMVEEFKHGFEYSHSTRRWKYVFRVIILIES
jgi:hypothetical protein